MRLLYLTLFPPSADAPHGGARAIAQTIRAMAERHEVALVHFQVDGETPVGSALRECGVRITAVPRLGDHGPLARRIVRGLRLGAAPVRGVPQWAAAVECPRFMAEVEALVQTWRPDVVQAELHVMGPYLAPATACGIPTVLVEHEPGVAMAEERRRQASVVARPWHHLNVAAWRRFEPAVLRSADAVVVFTEQDQRAVQELASPIDVVRIPVTVPLPEATRGPEADPPQLLFVGNFEHPPNRDAAARLTRSILPRVRAACPGTRLVVVGPAAEAFVAEGEGVVVTGWVPDLQPYLEAAAVVVAPLHLGGGMRVKVVEALGAGKAVVATPRAAHGLDVEDGVHLRLAPDDAAFAARVVELLRAPNERAALARRARAWAEAHLGFAHTAEAYDALYRRLVDR